jgi:photosystem II stability/assembly factor-like uncharacterized protein
MSGRRRVFPGSRRCAWILLFAAASLPQALAAGVDRWTSYGPYGGLVTEVVSDPGTPTTLYAGTQYGIFKTTDSGATWVSASAGLPQPSFVHAIVVDPGNSQIVYAGASDVFKSSDGGATWNAQNAVPPSRVVFALAIHPSDPSILYASYGHLSTGIRKTVDGGAHWSESSVGLPNQTVSDIALYPADPQIVFALAAGSLYRSVDGGQIWNEVEGGLPQALLVAIAFAAGGGGTTVYVATDHPQDVWKSTNAGLTWEPAGPGIPGAGRVLFHLSGALYLGGHDGLFRSADGGASWQPADGGLPSPRPGVIALAGHPAAPGILYAATETGLFKTTNAGASWLPSHDGIRGIPVNSVAMDLSAPGLGYSGTDYGVFSTSDGARSWRPRPTGFPTNGWVAGLALRASEPLTVYASLAQCCGVYRSLDGGVTWSLLAGSPIALRLALDPAAAGPIYASTPFDGVFKTASPGASWGPANTGIPSGLFTTDLAVDPLSPATLYVGTDTFGLGEAPGVYKTVNGAASWVRKSSGLPDQRVHSLGIDPLDPDTVYAGTQGGLYRTDDGAETWVPAQTGLPLVTGYSNVVTAIAVHPLNSQTVFVATDGGGVFRSVNRGASWAPFNAGLLALNVFDLQISPNGKFLLAGTIAGTFAYQFGAGDLHTLSPCRVFDTRLPPAPDGGPPLSAGAERVFDVLGRCGIPPTALALAANVTVTGATASGHLAVYAAGAPIPPTSTINYRAGQTRANNAILAVGDLGALVIRPSQAGGAVHVMLDVSAYFE